MPPGGGQVTVAQQVAHEAAHAHHGPVELVLQLQHVEQRAQVGAEDRVGRAAHHDERQRDARQHAPAPRRGHQHERDHQRGGQLDPHGHHEQHAAEQRPAAQHEQRAAQQRQRHQHVVVPAADRVHEQERVQGEEQRSRQRPDAQAPRAGPDQRRAADGREGHDPLQRPHLPRHAQRHERVREQSEQRAVGRGRVVPEVARGRERGIERDHRRAVLVGVEAVQHAHPRVGDVVEDVRREQRRRQREDRDQRDQRGHRDPRGQRAGADQRHQVERRHQHQQVRDPVDRERPPAVQRARHPGREAEVRRGHQHVGVGRGRGDDPQRGDDQGRERGAAHHGGEHAHRACAQEPAGPASGDGGDR